LTTHVQPIEVGGAIAGPGVRPTNLLQATGRFLWNLPLTVKLFAIGLLGIYVPAITEAAGVWLKDDKQAHGIFILPLVAFLLWLLRDDLKSVGKAHPTGWGLVVLGTGLAIQALSHVLGLEAFPLASLVPVLCGTILVLHGKALWRVVCFPVLFLLFMVPTPDAITLPVSARVQSQSTTLAAATLTTFGLPVIQTGNRIDTPTISVEVAEVCSGFKKLTSLVAFSFLYGFLFPISLWKRLALVVSTYPIALFANAMRVCFLTSVGSIYGESALKAAHDAAEIAVLVVAFVLFVLVGKGLGCQRIRFSL
jgi:exosortase